MIGADTGPTCSGFTIDQRHTDDVAWVGKLPVMHFRAIYGRDHAVTRLALAWLFGRHGPRSRRVVGPGVSKGRAAPRG